MQTAPLKSISLDEAMQRQFLLVDVVTRHFRGDEILSLGDLGVVKGINQPIYTKKVEKALAEFFGVERAKLVRGAGTGALRYGFMSFLKPGDKILVHQAPIYPTSKTTLDTMGVKPVFADFHHMDEVERVIHENGDLKGVLIQHTRQQIDDYYDLAETINGIHSVKPELIVITDDNYAAMKVEKIGVDAGADLSTFSLFKLLGPEGVGIVLGKTNLIEQINRYNYSGGSQVQGYEALETLRGLIYAPVMLAIQAQVNDELVSVLNSGAVSGVKKAFLANAQSKVLLVELEAPIADKVLRHANELGAAPNPVGAESKYEFVPMFYRVSGTFLAADPELAKTMIRINPLRSGVDTVVRILKTSIERAKEE
ncbi:aminotransferase class V-fold PLP-dependent enzyme [Virgibacillus sp. 179-BFC.A HS]|uniref:Aminotransferase class V-fold PLP-dependent enzyme n=1 Tax=Tigheibacillus jepli TaxID=3035914 RepID=A0ABU5CFZ6_9BACI|nr:aminotransferase class V-fold PLP-dependent enzyme [Virgibacillus sp. 179-BFC.A HS]MDY0404789.1 aminotransferase class V-fold PLP-dependent enzyme [Virgibacillus sp. 179-BFC.A HS]